MNIRIYLTIATLYVSPADDDDDYTETSWSVNINKQKLISPLQTIAVYLYDRTVIHRMIIPKQLTVTWLNDRN